MIGSSTLVVKKNEHYHVHICGHMFGGDALDYCLKNNVTPFDIWKESNERWGKPNAENLTFEDAERIRVSHHCIKSEKDRAGYSEFAGDAIWFLDLDAGKFFNRGKNDEWSEQTVESLKESRI